MESDTSQDGWKRRELHGRASRPLDLMLVFDPSRTSFGQVRRAIGTVLSFVGSFRDARAKLDGPLCPRGAFVETHAIRTRPQETLVSFPLWQAKVGNRTQWCVQELFHHRFVQIGMSCFLAMIREDSIVPAQVALPQAFHIGS